MSCKVKNVSVIGAGVMGRQIALNAAVHQFQVCLSDVSEPALTAASEWCVKYLEKEVSKGRMDAAASAEVLKRMTFSPSIQEGVKDADVVIEAIIEKLDVKRTLFENLSQWAPETALLTSNSSYIPSSTYRDIVKNPGRLANLHYFNPAMRMKLVEIVRGEHTDDATVEALKEFVTAIEKTYIQVNKEVEGFVTNRLLRAVQNEAYYLLENNVASFQDIDLAAELGLNWPMGPFRIMDLTGLDINYYNRQRKFEETGDESDRPPQALVERFEQGKFGRKTGEGWYRYDT